jgi:four helix bundle suffix protein
MSKNIYAESLIQPDGGYRKLKSYQKTQIVYDGTIYFTRRFFRPFDRTVEQMVQAARSGKQNIAEGSMASATSKETEIKLTNVARASLEELRLDYEDFLRSRKLPIWDKQHRLVQRVRELNRTPEPNYGTFVKAIEHSDPEICANVMICLITLSIFLINKQLDALQKAFVAHGGFKERMYLLRSKVRK